MAGTCFRSELDAYEQTLAQWAKFSFQTCHKVMKPNSLEISQDGSLYLLHQVSDMDQAINCRGGGAVRLLKLNLGNLSGLAVH